MPRSILALAAGIVAAALLHSPAPADWPADPTINLALATAAGAQSTPAVSADAAARATIMWTDLASGNADLRAQAVDAGGAALWTPGGAPVCVTGDEQRAARMAPDGASGLIAVWTDARAGIEGLYAQRLSSVGLRQWALDGIAVAPVDSAQLDPDVIADGSGGAIVAWSDGRNGASDIYAQRLDPGGTAAWTAGGVAVCGAAGAQAHPRVVSDGAGGAIVVWFDARGGYYAQRLDATGVPQWAPDGVLAVAATEHVELTAIADGAGGAIFSWVARAWVFDANVYAQRLDASGAPLWTAAGVAVCTDDWDQRFPVLASDGAGGAFVAWDDLRTFHFHEVYAQRIASGGAPQWAAWGIKVTTLEANQRRPALAADGSGGAVVVWQDERNGAPDVHAQRLDPSGAFQWGADGVAVCTAPDSQVAVAIVADGSGGAIVAWSDRRAGADFDLYAQRVLANGSLGGTLGVYRPPGVEGAWLGAPVPNPVREGATIRFAAGRASGVTLAIHDQLGRRVRMLAAARGAASGEAYWDGRDDEGRIVPSGVYFCRLEVDGRTLSRRLVTIR